MVKKRAYNEDEKENEIVCCDASMFYQLVNVKVHSSNLTEKNPDGIVQGNPNRNCHHAIILDIDMHKKVSDAF